MDRGKYGLWRWIVYADLDSGFIDLAWLIEFQRWGINADACYHFELSPVGGDIILYE